MPENARIPEDEMSRIRKDREEFDKSQKPKYVRFGPCSVPIIEVDNCGCYPGEDGEKYFIYQHGPEHEMVAILVPEGTNL